MNRLWHIGKYDAFTSGKIGCDWTEFWQCHRDCLNHDVAHAINLNTPKLLRAQTMQKWRFSPFCMFLLFIDYFTQNDGKKRWIFNQNLITFFRSFVRNKKARLSRTLKWSPRDDTLYFDIRYQTIFEILRHYNFIFKYFTNDKHHMFYMSHNQTYKNNFAFLYDYSVYRI